MELKKHGRNQYQSGLARAGYHSCRSTAAVQNVVVIRARKRNQLPSSLERGGQDLHLSYACGGATYSLRIALKTRHLFFNAYSLQRHGWYSQFVSGTIKPLPFHAHARGEHQLGLGYFDFGVGALRRYHLLFSKIQVDATAHAVVLRSVPENIPALTISRQVFILPPSGDVFAIDEAGLHWHHICTASGVRLLPSILDRWTMNALRALRLDSKERDRHHRSRGFCAVC